MSAPRDAPAPVPPDSHDAGGDPTDIGAGGAGTEETEAVRRGHTSREGDAGDEIVSLLGEDEPGGTGGVSESGLGGGRGDLGGGGDLGGDPVGRREGADPDENRP